MFIPKQVKIGARTYTVEMTDRPCKSDTQVDGEIVYSDSTIKIKNDPMFAKDYLEYILVHEILHGIYNHFSIEQNEDDITKVSRGIHMIIKDNPEIFKE